MAVCAGGQPTRSGGNHASLPSAARAQDRRQHCVTTGNMQLVHLILDEDAQRCLPTAWANLHVVDIIERASAGRALLRVDELVALTSRVDVLRVDHQ